MNFPKSPDMTREKPRLRDRWAKQRFEKLLSRLSIGQVFVIGSGGTSRFGTPGGLSTVITVHRNCFYRKALSGPVAISESYINGDWQCDDLTTLIQVFLRNKESIDQSGKLGVRLASLGYRVFHWLHSNTRKGSLRNIGAHYDLGNDFFRLWLDETMAYSSGVFDSDADTLQDASEEKFDRICRKLNLGEQDRVLEIGTGFGGYALHAAEKFGCNVTTTTISKKQFEFAESRISSSTAKRKVQLLQQDYRALEGKFDKLVSIEMIEAVGHRFLDQYFQKCSSLLRDDGSMLIQAIVMPERGYQRYLKSVDFIQRFVFPGGCLPSLATILESVGRSTDMRFVHAEDMAPHYAETLRRWRRSFESQLDEVRRQGYSESLIRTWRFYLCYCEAAFEERRIGVLQIQFDKPECRHDPVRIGDRAAIKERPFSPRPDFISESDQTQKLPEVCNGYC